MERFPILVTMRGVKIWGNPFKDFYHEIQNIFSRLCSLETKYVQVISKPPTKAVSNIDFVHSA